MISSELIKKLIKESLPIAIVLITTNLSVEFVVKYEFTDYVLVLGFFILSSFAFVHFYKEKKKLQLEKKKLQLEKKKFLAFLEQYEKPNYFIYRGKKKNRNIIEEKILNKLDSDTVVLFKKKEYADEFAKYVFTDFRINKIEGGYPFLLKIKNGKIIAISMNISINEAMKNSKNIDDLLVEIKGFYSK